MDLFLAGCQGLGLALAAGALLGAPGVRGNAGTVLAALAAVAGALLFGASLTPEDHPAWPGWIVGAPAALLSYLVARGVSRGARSRAGGSAAAGVVGFVAVYALVLAGLALLVVAPVALLALAGTAALAVSRQRRAAEKHAGLRSLR